MTFVMIFVVGAAIFGVMLWARSSTAFMWLVLGGISLSGILLMILERLVGLIPKFIAEGIISLVFVCLFVYLIRSRRLQARFGFSSWMLPLLSLTLALTFLATRLIASSSGLDFFSGAGRIAAAEDNAKWLNFSSILTNDGLINIKDGTSGGLAAFLIICSGFVSLASLIYLGGMNAPGIAIHTVLLGHLVLIVLAPLVVAPVLEKLQTGTQPLQFGRQHSYPMILGAFLAGLVVTVSVGAITTFGHLSFGIVFLQIAFWACCVVYLWPDQPNWVLTTLIGSSVALVWLPLPTFAMSVAGLAVVVAGFRYKTDRTGVNLYALILLIANVGVTGWLAMPEIQYLAATTQPSTSVALVVAEGGTMTTKKPELFLLGSVLTGVLLWIFFERKRRRLSSWMNLYPLLLLLGYSAAVGTYDLLIAPEGWPHYGSRKLAYLAVMVSITVLLPLGVLGLSYAVRGKKLILVGLAAILAGVFAVSQTVRQTSHFVFTASAWTVFDLQTKNGVRDTAFWAEWVNPRDEIVDTLGGLPVACVHMDGERIIRGYTIQYFCTRFLISLAGLESTSTGLAYPLLAEPTPELIQIMANLASNLSDRTVLVIDGSGDVTREITVRELAEIYKKSLA